MMDNNIIKTMKPCPKCHMDEPGTDTCGRTEIKTWWSATCWYCCYSTATYDTENEAVEAWNAIPESSPEKTDPST